MLVLELGLDNVDKFLALELEQVGEQAENKDVLAAVPGGSADSLHRRAGHGHPDQGNPAVGQVRLDVVRVVEANPAVAQCIDVIFVAVLVEGDQEVGIVTGGEDFTGTDPHLEDRGTTADG